MSHRHIISRESFNGGAFIWKLIGVVRADLYHASLGEEALDPGTSITTVPGPPEAVDGCKLQASRF